MKNLLIITLITLTIFTSCQAVHPWQNREDIAKLNHPIQVLGDLTDQLNLEGVYVFSIRKGQHNYILLDTGWNLTLIHDAECPSHAQRLEERILDSKEGF